MNTEQLVKIGLTEEQAKEVMNLHKEAINGNYIPKAKFDSEREKNATLQESLSAKDAEIEKLAQFKGTSEQLEAKISGLKETLEKSQAEYNAKIAEIEKDSAISLEVSDFVYDIKDVLGKLDKSKIIYENGKVVSGLKEQINDLKKSSPHYFKSGTDGLPSGWNAGGKKPKDGQEDFKVKEGEELGKSLAKMFNDSMNVSKTAEDMYFK